MGWIHLASTERVGEFCGGKADGLEGAFAGWEWLRAYLCLSWMPQVAVGSSIPRCRAQRGALG